jgi:hypothetical protein
MTSTIAALLAEQQQNRVNVPSKLLTGDLLLITVVPPLALAVLDTNLYRSMRIRALMALTAPLELFDDRERTYLRTTSQDKGG